MDTTSRPTAFSSGTVWSPGLLLRLNVTGYQRSHALCRVFSSRFRNAWGTDVLGVQSSSGLCRTPRLQGQGGKAISRTKKDAIHNLASKLARKLSLPGEPGRA